MHKVTNSLFARFGKPFTRSKMFLAWFQKPYHQRNRVRKPCAGLETRTLWLLLSICTQLQDQHSNSFHAEFRAWPRSWLGQLLMRQWYVQQSKGMLCVLFLHVDWVKYYYLLYECVVLTNISMTVKSTSSFCLFLKVVSIFQTFM